MPVNNDSYLALIFLFVLNIFLGAWLGSKKRIGNLWATFFLMFWFIPGIIAIVMSPSIKNLSPPSKSQDGPNKVLGFLGLLLGIGSIWQGLKTPDYLQFSFTDSPTYKIGLGIFFLIASYYMFNRYNRHKKMYEEQQHQLNQTSNETSITKAESLDDASVNS